MRLIRFSRDNGPVRVGLLIVDYLQLLSGSSKKSSQNILASDL